MSDAEKKNQAQVPPAFNEQVVAAGQQALEKIKKPTINVKPDEAIYHDPQAEVLRANQYRSGGWLHGPAQLELFANTGKRLVKIQNELGDPGKVVHKVQALRVKGTKLIYIWPTDKEDATGLEVRLYDSTAWLNLITLLGPADLTVEPGVRERYEVNFSQPGDHVYPALKLDLGNRLDRRKAGEPDDPGTEPQDDETEE